MAQKSFRKRADPCATLARIKLWPSRRGILHGLRSVSRQGNRMVVKTHCNQKAIVKGSKNGRVARWLRNKWYARPCPQCRVPQWKLDKYAATAFLRGKQRRYAKPDRFYPHPAPAPY